MARNAALAVLALAVALTLAGGAARPVAGQPQRVTVTLAPGWNNLAYVGPILLVPEALAAIAGRYEAVWTWDPPSQRWLGVNPLAPGAGDFAELRPYQAYWLRMLSAGELTMEVTSPPPPITLAPGWNNFVHPGGEQPITDALAGAGPRYTSVWRWDADRQHWSGFTPMAPAASDFTSFAPHRGYFVYLAPGAPLTLAPQGEGTVTVLSDGSTAATSTSSFRSGQAALLPSATPASVVTFPAHGGPATPVASMPSGPPSLPPLVPPGSVITFPTPGASPAAAASPMPTVPVAATGTPFPMNGRCWAFESYQPQLSEVSRAQVRAGFGALTSDPDFKLPDLETEPGGNGAKLPAYIPPTLLKAIAWVETAWRQASTATARGATGPTITSRSCAYGVMQIITGMEIGSPITPKRIKIGSDYLANIAAGAQLMGIKWNLAPDHLPVVLPRNPRALESWYFAVWAYHCFGEACDALGIHNHPEDPALKWPRPAYNSPEQLGSTGRFSFGDYPYQELVYGLIAHPPRVNNAPLWPPLAVRLPPRGTISFPGPESFESHAATLDPTLPE